VEREHLTEGGGTAGRVGRWVGEGERTEKASCRVKKRKDIGPGAVRSRVGGSNRVKENSVAKFDNIVGGSRKTVPEKPPTTTRVGEGGIIGVAAEKVTVVTAISGARSRSEKRLG